MSRHLRKQLDDLKKHILNLSAMVEDCVWRAVRSLEEGDLDLARGVIDGDTRIDQMEVLIEEECLKTLALHQPVATDLRFVVIILKMNNDLERIGDLAVNIAERAAFLANRRPVPVDFDFRIMAEKTQAMLNGSLDALVNSDTSLARRICAADDEVDVINYQIYEAVKEGIRTHPECIEEFIHILSASRHLERIADLATNIAEDIIYSVEGEIVRHAAEDFMRTNRKHQDQSEMP